MRHFLLLAALLPHAAFAAEADVAAAPADEEIIVTGERVARTLAETSSSVFVLTAADVARQGGAGNLDDILTLAPNLTLGGGESGPTIRGQNSTGVLSGADAFLGGSRPRATLSVDGRPLSFNEYIYALTPIWDVERVEVFRGPQTTTQGRNAVAGAIFVETRGPTPAWEGRARFQAGDYGMRQGSAALGGPLLGEALTARFAVDIRDSRDWVDRPNVPDIGVSTDARDLASGRAKLRFAPAALPGLTALLTYAHVETLGAQSDAIDRPFEARSEDAANAAFWRTNIDSVTLDVDAALGGGFGWSTLLAFADVEIDRFSLVGQGNGGVRLRERSIESILSYGAPADRLSGLLGLYYLDADQSEAIDLSAFLGLGAFADRQSSLGLFGEATFRPAARIAVTAGGRFQRDTQKRAGALGPFAVNYDRAFESFLPKASIAFEASPRLTIGAVAARGFNPGGTTISFQTGERDQFEAERLWNYELFARWIAPGGRYGVSANAFLTDYEGAQRPVTSIIQLPGGPELTTQIDNAEDARAFGFELEAFARPAGWLRLRGALGLLETELRRFTIAADPAAIEGNAFERSPGLTASAQVTIAPLAGLEFDASIRHTTSYYADDANTPGTLVPGFTIIDAQASYRWGNFKAFVFTRNLFDEFYLLTLYDDSFATGGEPRRLGGGIEVAF